MTPLHLRDRSIGLSVRIYQMLLFVYPPAFRREFGTQMLQVFRVACRAAPGSPGLLHFWFRTLIDLVGSAYMERRSAMRRQKRPQRSYVYAGALLLSVATGYLHLRVDADVLSSALLLGGACVFGLACPEGAWRWALIVGLGMPAALVVGHAVAAHPGLHHDADLPMPAPLVPALIGAYSGALVHRLFPRVINSSLFGRQQLG